MTTNIPTRAQIDRAEPLDFPERKSKADLTITVKARVDGFDTEICYTGSIDQLLGVTKRLRELGAEPVSAPKHIAPLARPKAERVKPFYDGDRQTCCSVHRKPLQEGRFGPFCPAKAKPGEEQNDKGYCSLCFTKE